MTSQVYNQAIAHIAYKTGGTPFCGSKRALISVAVSAMAGWSICKRCQTSLAKKVAK